MTRETELRRISERIQVMIDDDQTDNQTFINTVETLLALLEEHFEEQMKKIYELANRLRNIDKNGDYGVMYQEYTKKLVELLVGEGIKIESLIKIGKTDES